MIATPIAEGGVATHLQELAPRLRKKGHRITFITGKGYADLIEADDVNTYPYVSFPSKLYGFMPSAIGSILGVLKDCDIINIYGYPNFLTDYLTFTRHFYKKPLIVTLAGSFHQFTSTYARSLKRLHNACMVKMQKSVDKFVAVSQAEKDEVVWRGVSPDRVEVIYSAAAEEYLQVTGDKRVGEEKRVLYLGRLTASKNVGLLVEAMAHVVAKRSSVRLLLAGPNFGELKKLKALTTKLGVDRYVDFLGRVSEEKKAGLFNSCHVFVHPSTQDIFALTIIEAAMAGLPGIAFHTGGNPEMILNGETGVLVDELNPVALADAILEVTRTDEVTARMGQKARAYVASKFSWERTAAEMEALYYRVLGHSS